MSLRNRIFWFFPILSCVLSVSAAGKCPQYRSSDPRWAWTPLAYINFSSAPASAVAAAANGWYAVGAPPRIGPQDGPMYDILIYDDDTIPVQELARVILYSQEQHGTCNGIKDTCGRCMNYLIMHDAVIYVAPSRITTSALTAGIPVSSGFQAVIAHEFGHVVGVDDILPDGSVCSQIQSIMYQDAASLMRCQKFVPSSCDGSASKDRYAAYPPIWPGPYCPCGTIHCQ